jgi:signal transduction histidine kinase
MAQVTKAALLARVEALEKSLKREAGERKRLEKALAGSLEQQTATSEILRVISSSPTDAQPVFESIAASAHRLCGAKLTTVFRFDGRLIHIAALHDVSTQEISVTDTGVGIAPEDEATIFEEFRQVGSDETRKQEGTGLGLTLAKKFVELHGGRIWVESKLGSGATFTFTLPLS